MKKIRLNFSKSEHLDKLLEDSLFLGEIDYLNYQRKGNQIELTDPIVEHKLLDTELIVLSTFAYGVKRILFPNSETGLEYLYPVIGKRKNGIRLKDEIIIDSTEFI